ncbi:hypothetical protein HY408_00390 [Candidatus Gottesmanbacteria bacterium]|nr:hypothetical protein [Candidatus Gottesmanbacteria bacterium]
MTDEKDSLLETPTIDEKRCQTVPLSSKVVALLNKYDSTDDHNQANDILKEIAQEILPLLGLTSGERYVFRGVSEIGVSNNSASFGQAYIHTPDQILVEVTQTGREGGLTQSTIDVTDKLEQALYYGLKLHSVPLKQGLIPAFFAISVYDTDTLMANELLKSPGGHEIRNLDNPNNSQTLIAGHIRTVCFINPELNSAMHQQELKRFLRNLI